ncbi:acyclic terpene utilization AtuA family protein [Streptosporangium amethystogenes]|uniref:acyclic terpene utilization AtuA family protein n=1 Tax=Streptosporangium amethystogenes TaxID=2002 RepID=UPI0004C909EA|nr:acyclic terpene utilization AtuA family protein [Streptosporangium amethystogenes]
MLRIANCSGFYGDRLSAAREMVEGGPIDVLTGDWLAELTMLILAGNRLRGRPGYAPTFLKQLEEVLGTCLERGIKIVSNAGGLDPAGCAGAVTELATRLGLPVRVAHVTGDDLTGHDLGGAPNADTGEPLPAPALTANAYLGGRPIAAALSAGADVVVTGRVTDAALVTGPGIWRYGWGPGDLDALAGSVVAGHVIECGCQATGGNYAFFGEVPDLARCGFPLVELEADGSSVVTKHPGTGGLVSVGTVTAQLLYEIASPRYLGPDVIARFDTIRLEQQGPDRVRVSGVRGEAPPGTLKVAVNYLAGYRNTMTLVLTGLDIEAKARLAQEAIWARVPRESFDEVHVELTPLAGTALLRVTVMDADRRRAGRAFSSAVVETGLASYPGFYGLTPPGDASPYGVYWPTLIPAEAVRARVWLDGRELPTVPDDSEDDGRERSGQAPPPPVTRPGAPEGAAPGGPRGADGGGGTVRVALGSIVGARSGDKGGNANLGVWVRTPEQFGWLESHLTVERLAELLPGTAELNVERFELPNLLAVNFVVHGLLGRGVAASPRLDAQAKALGEELRAVLTDIPRRLL